MKRAIITAAVLSLAACASPGNEFYRPADSPATFGYSEVRLDDDRYRVSFTGNGAVGEDAVKELALMRAADLTRMESHDWFRLVTVETEETTRTVTGPGDTVFNTGDATTLIEGDGDTAVVLGEDAN